MVRPEGRVSVIFGGLAQRLDGSYRRSKANIRYNRTSVRLLNPGKLCRSQRRQTLPTQHDRSAQNCGFRQIPFKPFNRLSHLRPLNAVGDQPFCALVNRFGNYADFHSVSDGESLF